MRRTTESARGPARPMLCAMRRLVLCLGLFAAAACSEADPVPIAPASDGGTTTSADDATTAPGEDAAVVVADDAAVNADASADAGTPIEGPTWCRDVRPIVSERCTLCHGATPAFGAPGSLVAYADTQRRSGPGRPMHELMATRITAPQSRMPPPNQPQLTQDQVATLVRWSMNGAPEGDGCTTEPTPDAGVATDSGVPHDAGLPYNTFNLELRAHAAGSPADPYPLPMDGTNYQCWSFTIPPGSPEQYVVRFEHLIDNSRYVHHTLIFRNRAADSPAGPFGCGSPELDWDMVSGWAPGQPDESMPMGVGVRAFPGDQFIVQGHYDQVAAAGQTDRSGIRLVMTDQPGLQEAAVLWAGGAWSNGIQGSNVMRRGERTMNRDFTMFSVFPHMHKLGTRITLELRRAGSSTWDLVGEVPAWSFDDQPKIAVPFQFQSVRSGDALRTTCWWDTMGRSVGFGEASDDEMCFNFINHYPKLNNPTLDGLMFMQ